MTLKVDCTCSAGWCRIGGVNELIFISRWEKVSVPANEKRAGRPVALAHRRRLEI
jgi:hypothetical protein